MATLDSPLEVLAFDYVSFIFNNLWTWIALVTAAVSFWRIQAARDHGLIEESVCEPKTTATLVAETSPQMKVTETECNTPTATVYGASCPLSAHGSHPYPTTSAKSILLNLSTCTTYFQKSGCYTEDRSSLFCNDGVTKGKLTVYYDEEENDEERDGDDGESMSVNYGGGECAEWWERVVRMRNGGDGWYRYVDLTEMNGNVVRLWDANGVTNGGCIEEFYA